VKTEVQEITATKAKAYLQNNLQFERGVEGTNRPISLRKVNEYAIEMLKGEWRLTHQGIAFAVNGELKDGQHRLLALVQAAEEGATEGDKVYPPNPRIKIKFQVTYGLEENVFDKLDIGLARSAGQILAIAGYTNQSHLAASARLLYLFDNLEFKYWRSVKVTNHQILEVVRATNIQEYIPVTSQLSPVGFIAASTTVGYYVCERSYSDGPHLQFIDALKTGANLAQDNPALVLREYMLRSKSASRVRRDSHVHLALYIKSWNDFVNKRRRNAVLWRQGETFPTPFSPNGK
jgi:hypothetical protein